MIKDFENSAISLYDGGWRSCDKEWLMGNYELTEEEAEKICKILKELENKEII